MSKRKLSDKTIFYLAIFSTILMVVYAQFVLGHYSQCFSIDNATNSLGLYFGYTIDEVLAFVELRSVQQLKCYIIFLKIWDTIFPVLYTLMYVFWIVYLIKKWNYLLIIPIFHMILDWIENAIEISMIEWYINTASLSENLVSMGSLITTLKWFSSFLIYGILLYGIILNLRRFLSAQKLKYKSQ